MSYGDVATLRVITLMCIQGSNKFSNHWKCHAAFAFF